MSIQTTVMKTAEFCENRLTNKRDNTTVARTKAESQKRVKETPKARIKYTKRIKNTAAVVSWVPKQQHVSSSHKDKHKKRERKQYNNCEQR